jgi:hypothetical protein
LQAAVNAWRSTKRLTSAVETEAWVQAWGTSLDDLVSCLERRWLLQHLAGQVRPSAVDSPLQDSDAHELLPDELLFSDKLEALREAIVPRAAWESCADPVQLEAESSRLLVEAAMRDEADAIELLSGWDLEEPAARSLILREASARIRRREALESADFDAELHRDKASFVRLDLDFAMLPHEDAAREFVLCLRDDGESFVRAARRAEARAQRTRVFLRHLAREESGAAGLGAEPGDVIGPSRQGDGWLVRQVRRVIEPELGDQEILQAVEDSWLKRRIQPLIARRVLWPTTT